MAVVSRTLPVVEMKRRLEVGGQLTGIWKGCFEDKEVDSMPDRVWLWGSERLGEREG